MNPPESAPRNDAPAAAHPSAARDDWRPRVLSSVYWGTAAIGTALMINAAPALIDHGLYTMLVLHSLTYLAVVAGAVAGRVPFRARAILIVMMFFASAVVGVVNLGIDGGPEMRFFTALALASIFLGQRWGIALLVGTAVVYAAVFGALRTGWLELPPIDPTLASAWVSHGLTFVGLGGGMVVAITYLIAFMERTNARMHELVAGLEHEMEASRHTREELERSEQRLQDAQRAARIGCWEWNIREHLVWWSEETYRLHELDPESFVPDFESVGQLVHPDDRARVGKAMMESGPEGGFHVEFRCILPSGRTCYMISSGVAERDEAGEILRISGTSLDHSEAHALERRLGQTQRLEALGRLAGGVAHDFNNLLTIIRGYGDELQQQVEGPAHEHVEQIQQAAKRAANLTQQLLAFGRRQVVQPLDLDLNSVVSKLEPMLRRLIGADVDLHFELDPAIGRVRADTGQLEQVVVNLALNARDAMPRGGRLTFETFHAAPTQAPDGFDDEADPEVTGEVVLRVTDTGEGIAPEAHEEIFDPFFTTKDTGLGTGLGLATVYGIVKQSGGEIDVNSRPGVGTSFEIRLPVCADWSVREAAEVEATTTPLASGGQVVLLAEDEPGVRSLLRRWLSAAGYDVLEACDGEQALALAHEHVDHIDLLLSDVVMPRMGGVELCERLTRERPELSCILMTGYSDLDLVDACCERVLEKPLEQSALLTAVSEVLAKSTVSTVAESRTGEQ